MYLCKQQEVWKSCQLLETSTHRLLCFIDTNSHRSHIFMALIKRQPRSS